MRSRTLIPGLSWRGDQVALAVTPVVFGPPGMVAGAVAAWKGARWGGTAGVSGSTVEEFWWVGSLRLGLQDFQSHLLTNACS